MFCIVSKIGMYASLYILTYSLCSEKTVPSKPSEIPWYENYENLIWEQQISELAINLNRADAFLY